MAMATVAGDRRRSFRVPIAAWAQIATPDGLVCSYEIEDLSLGGVKLRGAPAIAIGEEIHIDLRVHEVACLSLHGVVVRRSGQTAADLRHAAAFRHMTAQAEGLIHDTLLNVLEHDGSPQVLVVDGTAGERAQLTASLRALGRRVIAARTPLLALSMLDDPEARVGCVVMSQAISQTSGVEFAHFLADAYPEVRRVLVAPRSDRAAAEQAQGTGLVHDVLLSPWTRWQIAAAVLGARARASTGAADARRPPALARGTARLPAAPQPDAGAAPGADAHTE